MGAIQQLLVSYGSNFVGPLDAYAADGLAIWGLSHRLFTSYTGPLFRVRRTGDDELDIAALSPGLFDAASLSAFVGADPWWFSQFYDQTGNGNHLTYAASGQPRGSIDGNGLAYAYAATGPNDVAMMKTGLSIAATGSTHWTVNAAPGFGMVGVNIHSTSDVKRNAFNYGNGVTPDLNEPGGTAPGDITITTDICSHVLQIGSLGSRLNAGVGVTTGTKTSTSITIDIIGVGIQASAPYWVANAKFYGGGVWIADVGNTNADAIQQIGKDLYFAQ